MQSSNNARVSLLVAAAVSGAIAFAAVPAQAADEKCYGVAKAGQNDCKAGAHDCKGQAKADNSPVDFKLVPTGQCAQMKGSLTPGK